MLDDLFVEFPFGTFAPLRSEFDLYLTDWGWTATKLRRSSRYVDVYDARWDDAGLTFRDWVTRPKQARWFRGLSEAERRELDAHLGSVQRHDRIAAGAARLGFGKSEPRQLYYMDDGAHD